MTAPDTHDSDDADRAADLIEHAIAAPRKSVRDILAKLEPLEAIALLGYAVGETINRFPPAHHREILKAFLAELLDDDA